MIFGYVVVDAEIMRQFLYGCALILIIRYRPHGLWPVQRAS
jgi:branched-chain amino acid transport system permease protein